MRVYYFFIFLFLFYCKSTTTTQVDRTLLTIDGKEVQMDEFIYSFKKSHQGQDTSYTTDQIDDYLQLFINYKLKVAEARVAGYDKEEAYRDELEQYQEEVKSSYRNTSEVMDDLVDEAYNRMKHEVRASHILIRLEEDASSEDTLKAYRFLDSLRQLDKSFDELAVLHSQDPSVKQNKGELGYFGVFNMVYPFENAAYQTMVGEISIPVKTRFGYHLVKVTDKREVENKSVIQYTLPIDEHNSNSLVFDIHNKIVKGVSEDQLKDTYDNLSILALNPSQVKRVPFSLSESFTGLDSGQVTDPIQQKRNWYIFKVSETYPIPPKTSIRPNLERMIRSSGRLQKHQEKFIANLKTKYDYTSQTDFKNLIENIDGQVDGLVIFTIQEKNYDLQSFLSYLQGQDQQPSLETLNDFIESELLLLEDEEIINSNDDLKWLLKEYEEGMLLFNIMEDSIWNNSTSDTVRLNNFIREKSLSDDKNKGQVIADYQKYIEDKWVQNLRKRHIVTINQATLKKVYEKLNN